MTEQEKLIEIYNQLEDAGLMVTAGKKDMAELMVSHDVVPVVRCKDCDWWDKGLCGRLYLYRDEDFYCAHGVRREGA